MPSVPLLHSSFLRWIIGLIRVQSGAKGHKDEFRYPEDDPITNSIECYACTEVGVPIFHSTSCDRTSRPELQATAGSSLFPVDQKSWGPPRARRRARPMGPLGSILDPRSKRVQRRNRAILIARGVSLAVDSLYFYALSLALVDRGAPCVYVDGEFAAAVTFIRTCVDALHLWHVWLQFRTAFVSRESLVVGCGKLVWDPRAVARHYVKSLRGFWLDVFVILPIPQTVFWVVIPKLISEDRFRLIMTLLLVTFLFQFLPKVYHSLCLMSKMRKVTGYIFGTIWWGFVLNLIAYLIASHVTGGCWYVLATQRVVTCLKQQCERSGPCNLYLSCSKLSTSFLQDPSTGNLTMLRASMCLDDNGPFNFGIYETALPVISSNSLATKIFYPIFWGLLNLSTFANNLAPTSDLLEVTFSIIIVLFGLMLFTLLVGNIQVFLQVVAAKDEKLQLRRADIEWWMRRRQLPSRLRLRVRRYEQQTSVVAGAEEEEMQWIEELPEGLRRDIKRFLCLDLIRKVPLFKNLDDPILDNICDRLKSFVFSTNEKIIREGDPVQRMTFILRGRVERTQLLDKSTVATSILEPGGFLGDELLSWCLRRPFQDRLPAASGTFICSELTEVFGLEVNHLRYIIEHFRYKFASERLKWMTRYYSSNWRTWAAVTIQMAWGRRKRRREASAVVTETESGGVDGRLRKYAAMFMSIRPHDHPE